MLCYFIEVAFINILKVFIRKTTGAERRLLRLGEEVPCKFFAAATIKHLLLQRADAMGAAKRSSPLCWATPPFAGEG